MNYYNASEIIKITGLGKSAVYKLINDLNTKLKREFPGTLIIRGKVPKWYFEKKLMINEIKREGNEEKWKENIN